jgi:hypothetical protein
LLLTAQQILLSENASQAGRFLFYSQLPKHLAFLYNFASSKLLSLTSFFWPTLDEKCNMLNVNPDIGQRKHPRHKVLKEGKIVSSNLNSVVDVKIRDLSIGGAGVQMPVNTDLPDAFCLLVVSENMLYSAVAKWRKGEMMGIAFVGEPYPASRQKSK